MTHEELVSTLRAAKATAEAHRDSEDGGACNFDHPVLFGIRKPQIEKAAEEAGVRGYVGKWFGRSGFHLQVGSGQANRNTRMAEAACKVLSEAGLQASMYYQLD